MLCIACEFKRMEFRVGPAAPQHYAIGSSINTAKRLYTVAQGRPELADGRTLGRRSMNYRLRRRRYTPLFNAFSVNDSTHVQTHGAPLDRLGATLGYGVKRLRRFHGREVAF